MAHKLLILALCTFRMIHPFLPRLAAFTKRQYYQTRKQWRRDYTYILTRKNREIQLFYAALNSRSKWSPTMRFPYHAASKKTARAFTAPRIDGEIQVAYRNSISVNSTLTITNVCEYTLSKVVIHNQSARSCHTLLCNHGSINEHLHLYSTKVWSSKHLS